VCSSDLAQYAFGEFRQTDALENLRAGAREDKT
jgi:hypothetical protein